MGIGDVDGDTIERAELKDKDFERFVKRLLKAERELRHRADADVNGPVADYHGDDKRDLEFVVHGASKPLRTEFTAALTWDEPGKTWYSCRVRRGAVDHACQRARRTTIEFAPVAARQGSSTCSRARDGGPQLGRSGSSTSQHRREHDKSPRRVARPNCTRALDPFWRRRGGRVTIAEPSSLYSRDGRRRTREIRATSARECEGVAA